MPQDILLTPQLDPLRLALLTRLAYRLDTQLDHPSGQPKPVDSQFLLELGTQLWDASALATDTLRTALDEARDAECPMRLVVQGEAGQHLPWELLYHAHPELGFVAQQPWCVITRRLHDRKAGPPRLWPRPLRLLLCIAAPEDLNAERDRLDFEHEEELLFTALDRPLTHGEVEIDVTEDGVLSTLLSRLEAQRYHAVILSMHGTQARNRQGAAEWGLLFEDAHTGRQAPVAGSELAAQFDRLPRGHRPGLTILAACHSARADDSATALSSVAARLHTGGCERVLGMRLAVLDGAVSTFNAALFPRLAQGEDVGRAVTLARQAVAQGTWWQAMAGLNGNHGDPWAQWSLPVLLDRTQDGPLVDITSPAEPRPPWARPSVLIGDGTLRLPQRQTFIGRRREMRQYLRAFLEGEQRRLLFTGPGGVGKTTLAGLFARNLSERQPQTRLLGFQAPFALETLYEPLRREAFDGHEEASLLPAIQAEPDLKERLRRLLQSLAQRRNRPCALVLDNLEAIQDLDSLTVPAVHEDSLWFLRTVCELPAPTRVLLTGRYPLAELPSGTVALCLVPDAPYGDVLRRMQRLTWPADMTLAQKCQFYGVLGGNHRAIEWAAQLLTQQHHQTAKLVAALEACQASPATPVATTQVVVEAMRQNMLFARLRALLTPSQDHLLRAASLYRVPVHIDGLLAVATQPSPCDKDSQVLLAYALLESAYDAELGLDYVCVPPIVRELLGEHDFSPEALRALHLAMGHYHRFQGEHVSRRLRDDVEAIYHLRQAEEHTAADVLAERVCFSYYFHNHYAAARALTEEILQRTFPPPPWWALNRYGVCQLVLGQPESALMVYQQALPLATTRVDTATTLYNLGDLYRKLGDYETAQHYLQQSLTIQRDLGDKHVEGALLHAFGGIARAQGDYDKALHYFEQSLANVHSANDKRGEGTILNDLGDLYRLRGDKTTAIRCLEQSLAIMCDTNDKTGEGSVLNNLGLTYLTWESHDIALRYFEQSLDIARLTGNKEAEGTTLHNLGLLSEMLKNYEVAQHYLEQSLAIRRTSGDKMGEGITLSVLGSLSLEQGDAETAQRYLTQSLTIHRTIGYKEGESATLCHLGSLFENQKDYGMAIFYYEQGLALHRVLGDKSEEGAVLHSLGKLYMRQGDYSAAQDYFEQSLAIWQNLGDNGALVITITDMGFNALRTNDQERAMNLWLEAFTLATETQNTEGIVVSAYTLGMARAHTGAYEEARQLLQQAVNAGQAFGLPSVKEVEAALHRLPPAQT